MVVDLLLVNKVCRRAWSEMCSRLLMGLHLPGFAGEEQHLDMSVVGLVACCTEVSLLVILLLEALLLEWNLHREECSLHRRPVE